MGSKVPWLYVALACMIPWAGEDADPSTDNDRAQFNTATVVGILFAVITLIIVVFLLSGVASEYFNATENITTAVDNASTGNDTIDQLMPTFGLLTAAVLVIGFIKLVLDQVDT